MQSLCHRWLDDSPTEFLADLIEQTLEEFAA